jgi:hypothetical protein
VFCGFATKATHPFLNGSYFSAACKYKGPNLTPKGTASSFIDYVGLWVIFFAVINTGPIDFRIAKSGYLCKISQSS